MEKNEINNLLYTYGAIITQSICEWNAEYIKNLLTPKGKDKKEVTPPTIIYKKTAEKILTQLFDIDLTKK